MGEGKGGGTNDDECEGDMMRESDKQFFVKGRTLAFTLHRVRTENLAPHARTCRVCKVRCVVVNTFG